MVADDDPRDTTLKGTHDRVRVARRLQRDLVARRQTVGEHPQRLRGQRDLPGLADQPVPPDRDLREVAMHVQPEASARHGPHLHSTIAR